MMFLHWMRQTRVQLWEEKKGLKYDGIFDAKVYKLASGKKRWYQTKLGLSFAIITSKKELFLLLQAQFSMHSWT